MATTTDVLSNPQDVLAMRIAYEQSRMLNAPSDFSVRCVHCDKDFYLTVGQLRKYRENVLNYVPMTWCSDQCCKASEVIKDKEESDRIYAFLRVQAEKAARSEFFNADFNPDGNFDVERDRELEGESVEPPQDPYAYAQE